MLAALTERQVALSGSDGKLVNAKLFTLRLRTYPPE